MGHSVIRHDAMRREFNRSVAFSIATTVGSTLCFQVGSLGWEPCRPVQESLTPPSLPELNFERANTCAFGESEDPVYLESSWNRSVELRLSRMPRAMPIRQQPE